MSGCQKTYEASQHARFMRPDARIDGSGSGQSVAEAEGDTADRLVQDILVNAEQLKLTGSLADYRKCVDLCYPSLSAFLRVGAIEIIGIFKGV